MRKPLQDKAVVLEEAQAFTNFRFWSILGGLCEKANVYRKGCLVVTSRHILWANRQDMKCFYRRNVNNYHPIRENIYGKFL
jgi:hypothetical protein